MKLSIKINGIDDAMRSARILGEQAPMAVAKSLTAIAVKARNAEKAKMAQVFDRPTPYALNSMFIKMATPELLEAKIWVRPVGGIDAQEQKFLGMEVFGSEAGKTRRHKPFEKQLIYKGIMPEYMYAVPTRSMPRDAYGNMSRGELIRLLSYLGAIAEVRTRMNRKPSSKRKINYAYLYVREKNGNYQPGIYKLTNKRLDRIIAFIPNPSYDPKFPFHDVGAGVFRENWRETVNEQILGIIKRAKRK